MHTTNARHIAIIAGTGNLPIQAAHTLLKEDPNLLVISLFPDDNAKQLEHIVGKKNCIGQSAYKVGTIKKVLRAEKVTHVLFIGKVDKRSLLKKISYDWEFAKLAAQLLYKNDSAIMELLIKTLESDGIATLRQNEILSKLTTQPGILCGQIMPDMKTDIALGMKTAHILSQADIGQTVVVKDGMVLAVEAIEGTDECIARGIALGKTDVVICKTCTTQQNTQYDLPTLGPQTLSYLHKGQVKAIAWHEGSTLIIDQEDFIAQAQEKGITLVCLAKDIDTQP